jgi:uncharacterized membrane protein
MANLNKLFERAYSLLLSEKTREKSERIIIGISIISFLLHLLIIFLNDFGFLNLNMESELLTNPIAAIYTPFSFILFYEVYLLVYYLPKSITIYIGKQYEIITLIIIRRIFKDLANLELTPDWFSTKYDLQFTYDILATLILFFFIYLFYRLSPRKAKKLNEEQTPQSPKVKRFIGIKKWLSVALVPTLLVLAVYSLGDWVYESIFSLGDMVSNFGDVNKVFYDDFFTILILTDTLLLLFSFTITDDFRKVIRNSGFVISTILIKLSFSAEGIFNTLFVVVAILFGVAILWIHNRYKEISTPEETG